MEYPIVEFSPIVRACSAFGGNPGIVLAAKYPKPVHSLLFIVNSELHRHRLCGVVMVGGGGASKDW